MSRFPRCFLHIGFEKTGSTSIQAFLTENRGALARRGYFVPTSLSRADGFCNHVRLSAFALADHKLTDDVRLHYGLTAAHQLARFREDTLAALRQEAAQAPDCRTIVLSNEHLSSRVDTLEEIARLKRLIEEVADSVKVFAYLRSQTGVLQSVYNEAVKVGFHRLELLPDFSSPEHCWISRRYFEYGTTLQAWCEVFGQDQVIVKLFEPDALLYGDVVRDFLFSIHIDPSRFKHFPRYNEGLNSDAQRFLQQLNRSLGRIDPAHASRIRERLVAILMDKARGRGYRLDRAQAASFMAQFAEENEQVRRRWFPDRSVLFGALDAASMETGDGDDDAAMFDMMGLVLQSMVD